MENNITIDMIKIKIRKSKIYLKIRLKRKKIKIYNKISKN